MEKGTKKNEKAYFIRKDSNTICVKALEEGERIGLARNIPFSDRTNPNNFLDPKEKGRKNLEKAIPATFRFPDTGRLVQTGTHDKLAAKKVYIDDCIHYKTKVLTGQLKQFVIH